MTIFLFLQGSIPLGCGFLHVLALEKAYVSTKSHRFPGFAVGKLRIGVQARNSCVRPGPMDGLPTRHDPSFPILRAAGAPTVLEQLVFIRLPIEFLGVLQHHAILHPQARQFF